MKEILFSVTSSDCEWSFTKGTGSGGQKKNKTSSAVHCMHRPSRAHGYAEDSRSQTENRRTAFKRMVDSLLFKQWLRAETMRRNGQMAQIEANVQKQLRNVLIELKENGKWVPERIAFRESL